MNQSLKKDLEELLKRFKRLKSEKDKLHFANDLANLIDTAGFAVNFNVKKQIPGEVAFLLKSLDEALNTERSNIKDQIYDNLDNLEKIYESFLNVYDKYNFSYSTSEDKGVIDLDDFHDFFKQYGNMDESFRKIRNEGNLFIIEGQNIAFTVNFRVLDKQYIFISTDNYSNTMSSLTHEMGHVYANNIYYNDKIDDFHILVEFMSFLIQLSFTDHKLCPNGNQSKISLMAITGELVRQSLAQIKLMKRHPDAFTPHKVNPKYQSELDSLCNPFYDFERYTLYSQLYAINYLIAINYYYQLKYGLDFNEVEKFYIENLNKNDLSSLLQNIDLDACYQLLNEIHVNKPKKRII